MALQTSGAISLANVQTEFGGVNPISISEYYGKVAGIPASGTISLSHFYGKSNGVLTLKEVVFNASGTFTVPSGAINNTFYVGCTGGGGYAFGANNSGGGGSGRTSGTFTLTPNSQIAVTVGAGASTGAGGTSSFGGYVSCAGANGRSGVSGGGNGGRGADGTSSNCPAMFTLQTGAVDNTNKFYTANSYAGGTGGAWGAGGGAGCYGAGSAYNGTAPSNTGAGAGIKGDVANKPGGSGKVVIYYYAMV